MSLNHYNSSLSIKRLLSATYESLFFASGVVVVGLNAIFQHTIGYTWRPVLMVEKEIGKSEERTTDPREATSKLSHISTFAESYARTHADRGEMVVIRNGQHFRPLGQSGPLFASLRA
ncbi:hypothetical protein CHS0354_038606 [Potamilus streckersoni]|uniref:Uncharacterized protein n=1 Tax=Potamilus streckersoni TaxID=2493646 RepID=A0AAE0TFX0_9BIVA|nr:hypothetical protein CHS0354_038606 [Potamilus streckersoni]